MANEHKFPPELEERLKKPWGLLIRGPQGETAQKIRRILEEEETSYLVTVGDAVSKNLVENGILPNLMIIDNRIMRAPTSGSYSLPADEEVHVKNPPSTITEEAIEAIQNSVKKGCRIKIIVDGEEDLLTPVAALYAPLGSIVVYGQPGEGAVLVRVTEDVKAEAADIVKAIIKLRKTK
ncbi:MAG: GTP-dependent dephospho-CoA kinase family protein [Candidatus Bathyarchaeia archaeon]